MWEQCKVKAVLLGVHRIFDRVLLRPRDTFTGAEDDGTKWKIVVPLHVQGEAPPCCVVVVSQAKKCGSSSQGKLVDKSTLPYHRSDGVPHRISARVLLRPHDTVTGAEDSGTQWRSVVPLRMQGEAPRYVVVVVSQAKECGRTSQNRLRDMSTLPYSRGGGVSILSCQDERKKPPCQWIHKKKERNASQGGLAIVSVCRHAAPATRTTCKACCSEIPDHQSMFKALREYTF